MKKPAIGDLSDNLHNIKSNHITSLFIVLPILTILMTIPIALSTLSGNKTLQNRGKAAEKNILTNKNSLTNEIAKSEMNEGDPSTKTPETNKKNISSSSMKLLEYQTKRSFSDLFDPSALQGPHAPYANLHEWFLDVSGYTNTNDDFGTYITEDIGPNLYIGIGAGAPTGTCGAMLSVYNGSTVNEIEQENGLNLQEDGIHTFRKSGNRLYIAGTDPCDGGWDTGNFYYFQENSDGFLHELRYKSTTPTFVASTTTNSVGEYYFTGLIPDAYMVKIIPPDGYQISPQNRSSWWDDSDMHPVTGIYDHGNDQEGAFASLINWSAYRIDAGLYYTGNNSNITATLLDNNPTYFQGSGINLHGWVWNDINHDGIWVVGERDYIPNVRIELYAKNVYFPYAQHDFGLWVDNTNDNIYYATALWGYASPVYKSTDHGITWQFKGEIRQNWVMDIAAHNGVLYGKGGSSLFKSTNDGVNWASQGVGVNNVPRFTNFSNYLISSNNTNDKFVLIDESQNITQKDAPLIKNAYNNFVSDNNGNFYFMGGTDGKQIISTRDFETYFVIAETADPIVSLNYWDHQNKLVFGTKGRPNAKLTAIDLNQIMHGVASTSSVITMNEGTQSTYSLALTSQPTADVTINYTVQNPPFGPGVSLSNSSLTFTPENWNIPQDIIIDAINDDMYFGTRVASIHTSSSSLDGNYNNININSISITINDDDEPVPISVIIEDFSAGWINQKEVKIGWTTTSEINNLGFNIWRGTNPKEPSVKINPTLIPSCSPGGNQGCSYNYTDLIPFINSKTQPLYYYWLEGIDLNGTVTRHGPVLAQQPASDN